MKKIVLKSGKVVTNQEVKNESLKDLGIVASYINGDGRLVYLRKDDFTEYEDKKQQDLKLYTMYYYKLTLKDGREFFVSYKEENNDIITFEKLPKTNVERNGEKLFIKKDKIKSCEMCKRKLVYSYEYILLTEEEKKSSCNNQFEKALEKLYDADKQFNKNEKELKIGEVYWVKVGEVDKYPCVIRIDNIKDDSIFYTYFDKNLFGETKRLKPLGKDYVTLEEMERWLEQKTMYGSSEM